MVQRDNMRYIPIWFFTNFQCRLMITSLGWVRMWGWRRRCRHRRSWTRIMLRWWCVAFDNSISLVNYVTSVIYRAIALTSHNNEAIDYTVVCMCFSSDIFIPFWSGLKCIKTFGFFAYDLNWRMFSPISYLIRAQLIPFVFLQHFLRDFEYSRFFHRYYHHLRRRQMKRVMSPTDN